MEDYSKKKKTIYILVVVWLVFALVGFGFWFKKARKVAKIETFEECVAYGYPVLEGYPDRCKGPGEQYFEAQPQPGEKEPVKSTEPLECRISNCHGLEIECGLKAPFFCDAQYILGDMCRRFARCEMIEGQCQLVKEPEFEECRACVEKCLAEPEEEQLACEEGCR